MLNRDGLTTYTSSAYRRAFIRMLRAAIPDGPLSCKAVAAALHIEGIKVEAGRDLVADLYSGGIDLIREDSEIVANPDLEPFLSVHEAKERVRAEMHRLETARRGD